MTHWIEKVNIKPAIYAAQNDDITLHVACNRIAKELRTLSAERYVWSHKLADEMDELAKQEYIETEEFDGVLEEIYDSADLDLVWLGV